jgi:hypothetical protein
MLEIRNVSWDELRIVVFACAGLPVDVSTLVGSVWTVIERRAIPTALRKETASTRKRAIDTAPMIRISGLRKKKPITSRLATSHKMMRPSSVRCNFLRSLN